MKVLALNSSARSEGVSKTGIMLNSLVLGMREAGADVETVNLCARNIKACIGCFTCWTKTPGLCVLKDDMTRELYPRWLKSDLVVYATPLYYFTVNAVMKTFIERTLPVLQPFFKERKGRTKHPMREKHPSVVMLSVAGFPEDSVFDMLSSWANFVFRGVLAAEIYRACAEILTAPFYSEKAAEVLEATRQAGRELVESKKVRPETMAKIKQPFAEDLSIFLMTGNAMWKTCIAEGLTPAELAEKGIPPRPDSIETFMIIMPMGFDPRAAADLRAVIGFDFSGDVEGSCHFKIKDGEIQALPGKADNPDLTVETPFNMWMDIMTGKADGKRMFMEGKFGVKGDMSLLMRMSSIFGRR